MCRSSRDPPCKGCNDGCGVEGEAETTIQPKGLKFAKASRIVIVERPAKLLTIQKDVTVPAVCVLRRFYGSHRSRRLRRPIDHSVKCSLRLVASLDAIMLICGDLTLRPTYRPTAGVQLYRRGKQARANLLVEC
jgi:hypothetical protein